MFKFEKYILEGYGLLRITLGVAQLVGLCASYFFLEFILKYPVGSHGFVLNEDVIVLTYLAILFRSLFHLFAGIGIARLSNGIRIWLLFGWPIMLAIAIGLGYTIAQSWVLENKISGIMQVVAWPKLILYGLFILLDWVWVNNAIVRLHHAKVTGQIVPLKSRNVMLFLFFVVVFFVILIFLGKPMRQGFHQGFYKSRGVLETNYSRSQSEEVKRVIKPRKNVSDEGVNERKDFFNLKEIFSSEDSLPDTQTKTSAKNISEEFDYKRAIPVVAGLLVVLGMIFQLGSVFRARQTEGVSTIGYVAWGFAAGILSFFGYVSGQLFLSLVAGIFGLGCVGIVCMKLKLQ